MPRLNKVYPVFASHSSKDKPFLRSLTKMLQAEGISVWEDKNVLRVGELWTEPAEQGIKECQAFVLIITPDAIESPNVEQEVNWAKSYSKPILPIWLECPQEWNDWLWVKKIHAADFTYWSKGRRIHKRPLMELVDGINSHRLAWFRAGLITCSGDEYTQHIQEMYLRLGERALPDLVGILFSDFTPVFEPNRAIAVVNAIAKIGGDFAREILTIALMTQNIYLGHMPAIIRAVGEIGDDHADALLNIEILKYKREKPELIPIAMEAQGKIYSRSMAQKMKSFRFDELNLDDISS